MHVRFWGTRGSIAAAGPETLRYGGNTACVETRTDDGTILVFDCGTGARKLGIQLAQQGARRIHLFIGHTHADHIQGLPFFAPAFIAGTQLTIYGPSGLDRSLPTAVGGQMDYAYFPVPLGELPSKIDFVEMGEGSFSLPGGITVRTQFLNHTAPCLGYRVEVGGASMVYATDHEPHHRQLWRTDRPRGHYERAHILHPGDRRHVEFLEGADLVIHDAQYLESEYSGKLGWGHSTVEYATDVAIAASVRRLTLFHHDPTRTDEAVDALLAEARIRAAGGEGALEIEAASEGHEITLTEGRRRSGVDAGPRASRIVAQARILVAEDDDDVAHLLDVTLRRDGYDVVRVARGDDAVEAASRETFDLIMLDVMMPGLDGREACVALREMRQLDSIPIVMMTASCDDTATLAGLAEGATDYISKPFAVSQVRARVRAWLTRTPEEATAPA